MALTAKQKAFVQEYLVDLNATAAAGRAGYKDPNKGRQLVTKGNIANAIADAMKQREARTQITQDRVLNEIAKIAFGDGTAYAKVVTKTDEDTLEEYQTVELTETDLLTADQRAAISGIKKGKHGIEVARYDKLRALELLGKHLGIFDDRLAANRADSTEECGVAQIPAKLPRPRGPDEDPEGGVIVE